MMKSNWQSLDVRIKQMNVLHVSSQDQIATQFCEKDRGPMRFSDTNVVKNKGRKTLIAKIDHRKTVDERWRRRVLTIPTFPQKSLL
jgi:hypothetical protein